MGRRKLGEGTSLSIPPLAGTDFVDKTLRIGKGRPAGPSQSIHDRTRYYPWCERPAEVRRPRRSHPAVCFHASRPLTTSRHSTRRSLASRRMFLLQEPKKLLLCPSTAPATREARDIPPGSLQRAPMLDTCSLRRAAKLVRGFFLPVPYTPESQTGPTNCRVRGRLRRARGLPRRQRAFGGTRARVESPRRLGDGLHAEAHARARPFDRSQFMGVQDDDNRGDESVARVTAAE